MIFKYFMQLKDNHKGKLIELFNKEKLGDWGKDTEQGNYNFAIQCIRGSDIVTITNNSNIKTPTRYILNKNNYKALKNGDLVVEISGGSPIQSTGRILYINDMLLSRFKSPVICSNFCKAFSLKDADYQYFFYTLWQHLYDKKVFFGYEGKTTGIKNLLFDSFIFSYETTILSNSNMKKYNDLVIPIFDKIQLLLKENDTLIDLRDWLLPMLMNGQIEVID